MPTGRLECVVNLGIYGYICKTESNSSLYRFKRRGRSTSSPSIILGRAQVLASASISLPAQPPPRRLTRFFVRVQT